MQNFKQFMSLCHFKVQLKNHLIVTIKKTINKIWLQLYQVPIFWNKIESLATKLQEHQHVIATFA